MARGLIRFYGHGAVNQQVGFTVQVLFRFNPEGYYDLDAVSVTPMVLSKLMRRFVYQNIDEQGNFTSEKMLNGQPWDGARPGVRIIVNEQKKETPPEETPQTMGPVPQEPIATPEEPAQSGTVTVAGVKAAKNRKEVVMMAKAANCDFSRSDNTETIRAKIIKHLEE